MSYYNVQPASPQRPTAVTVIAILGIVFGALGLLSLPINLLQMAGGFGPPGPAQAMWHHPVLGTFLKAMMPISGLTSALWIVSGIGLWQLRPWGRGLAIALLVLSLISQFVSCFVMLPILPGLITASMTTSVPGGLPPGFEPMMRTMMVVGVTFGVLIGLGLSVTGLVLLTRPGVAKAFQPQAPPPTTWSA